MILIRYYDPEHGAQLGIQHDNAVYRITGFALLSSWLRVSIGHVEKAIEELQRIQEESVPGFGVSLFADAQDFERPHRLAPVDEQDIWASGVTYERSREARQEEATDGGDVYARVYDAQRPELFFKSHGRDVVGHLGEVGIRKDAKWSVPEPELAVVLNPAMEIVGFTIGNDMSSRDIEGENPLYLPQAKVYTAACALGPGILLSPSKEWLDTTIRIRIERDLQTAFEGEIHTKHIRRTLPELVEYLGRSNHFPNGVVLLTGTGVVPPAEFTLQAGDVVHITIDGIGTLTNTVKVV
jgi:2-dehydro-3-deoxy-D-arabinonate dehydratase